MTSTPEEVQKLLEPEPEEKSNACDMCQFLYTGYKNAHSKQARGDYGEGFLMHYTRYHHEVFGDI